MTPTKATRNDGAEDEETDAQVSGTESDLDEELLQKQRRTRTILKNEVVKRWVTGDRAEKDDAEIQVELETEMRNLMELSGQKKIQKNSWTQGSSKFQPI